MFAGSLMNLFFFLDFWLIFILAVVSSCIDRDGNFRRDWALSWNK